MPFTNEEIIKKLVEIDAEFNKRWHDNTDDAGAAGCCKLLNSLIAFLKDKEKNTEHDESDYVLTRLLEAFICFADCYKLSTDDALVISGFKSISE